MKILVTYCHPNPQSFAAAIKDRVIKTAEDEGHEVVLRDLYQQRFNPVLSASDLQAIRSGQVPDDIALEQKYITEADLLIFIYPLWWTGLPAMLKGYIDRVYSREFAYTYTASGPLGLLPGKKALVITNSGTPKEVYEQSGMYQSLNQTSNEGIFQFCGIEVLDHIYFEKVPVAPKETLMKYLDSIEQSVKNLPALSVEAHLYNNQR